MKKFVRKILPAPLFEGLRAMVWTYRLNKYKKKGRPPVQAESTKAKERRRRERYYDKYFKGKGLDIGYGGDPIIEGVDVWDFEHGDAQYLDGMKDESYDFVYSSHTIEHMTNPGVALRNWWRVVKPGGYLIFYGPHRDLYEKKKQLPSNWNSDHKYFFLLDEDDPPDTLGVLPLIKKSLRNYDIIVAKVCDEGHTITDPAIHSDGEYSFEIVLFKKK